MKKLKLSVETGQVQVEGRAAFGASLSNAMLELGGKNDTTSPR